MNLSFVTANGQFRDTPDAERVLSLYKLRGISVFPATKLLKSIQRVGQIEQMPHCE